MPKVQNWPIRATNILESAPVSLNSLWNKPLNEG